MPATATLDAPVAAGSAPTLAEAGRVLSLTRALRERVEGADHRAVQAWWPGMLRDAIRDVLELAATLRGDPGTATPVGAGAETLVAGLAHAERELGRALAVRPFGATGCTLDARGAGRGGPAVRRAEERLLRAALTSG